MTGKDVTVQKYFKAKTDESDIRHGMTIKTEDPSEKIFGEGTIDLSFPNSSRENERFYILRDSVDDPLKVEYVGPEGNLHFTLVEVGEALFELQMETQHYEYRPQWHNPGM